MKQKLKICAGFNGIPHTDYIYKNIDGKKYCKSCAFKLNPPKKIKKFSEKGKMKIILKKKLTEEDHKFYTEVWNYRSVNGTCNCYNCNKIIGPEYTTCNFHHILEKRNYPELRHTPLNIMILCAECHNKYETFPDSTPSIKDRRNAFLEYIKVWGTDFIKNDLNG